MMITRLTTKDFMTMAINKAIGYLVAFMSYFGLLFADTKLNEAHYQRLAAKELQGEVEVVLKDKTRVDILTKTHAIEVDWASKWAEGIGQSLHYSGMTGKDAGLVLIVKDDKDDKYVIRVLVLLKRKSLRIKLWVYDTRQSLLWEAE